MDLDNRQTRRLFLAGTVAFPTPFPSVGTISFQSGNLSYSPGVQSNSKDVVVVQDQSDRDWTRIHSILREHVAAVFIPGTREHDGRFQIARDKSVDDDEKGEWFIDSDVSAEAIRARLRLTDEVDITSPDSILRGIVFVVEFRPVVSNAEMIATAAATRDYDWSQPVMRVCCLCTGR